VRYEATIAKWRANLSAHPPDRHHEPREEKFVADYASIAHRRRQFRKIVLCSMLGNYPHSQHRIASANARIALYNSVESKDRPQGIAWFQSMLHGCPSLVVWSVREFLVHTILDNDALQMQVGELMHFDSFRDLTARAMAAARTYLEQNAMHAWSSLGRSLIHGAPSLCTCLVKRGGPCTHLEPWLKDMTKVLQPFHEQMLCIQYHKPKIDAVAWLVSSDARKAAGLVPRRLSPDEKQAFDESRMVEDDVDEDDLYEVSFAPCVFRIRLRLCSNSAQVR
jgi:hypothetical protein